MFLCDCSGDENLGSCFCVSLTKMIGLCNFFFFGACQKWMKNHSCTWSPCSRATALHDFLKVWCAVCIVQGAACSSVCPVSCEVLAVWGVQCALCITKILPPSLLIVVWIHMHSGCADLNLLCFRAFLPDTHQPGRAPFHIFIVSKFTFLHRLGSIKVSLYLPRRCALPSHIWALF